jgi:hypothetical protein
MILLFAERFSELLCQQLGNTIQEIGDIGDIDFSYTL